MSTRCLMSLLFLFAISGEAGIAAESDIEEIREVCNRAIENRLKIKQWHVQIDSVNTGKGKDNLPLRMVQYVDGSKRREERTRIITDEPDKKQTSIQILGDKNFYLYDKLEDTGKPTMPLYQAVKDSIYVPENRFTFDYRMLGFTPYKYGVLGDDSISDYLGGFEQNKRIEEFRMEDEVLNGIPCKKFSMFLDKGDSHNTFWIAPGLGYCPIRAETGTKSHGFFVSTDVKVARYKDTDLWVPVEMIYEYAYGGQQESKMEQKITVYSINEPIDPIVFTPEGLDIPVGTPIDMRPESYSDEYVWDGKKAATTGEMLVEQILKEKPARWNRFRYLLMATGLILICIAFFSMYMKSKKR